jgi:hypothetical protein
VKKRLKFKEHFLEVEMRCYKCNSADFNIICSECAKKQEQRDIKCTYEINVFTQLATILGDPRYRDTIIAMGEKLSPREVAVLEKRLGIASAPQCTLEDVGKIYSVTRERVRQIEIKAMRKFIAALNPEKVKKLYDAKPLKRSISSLRLGTRAHHCLLYSGIKNVEDLVKTNEKKLLKIKNLGRKGIRDIKEVMENSNLFFGMLK